MGSVSDERLLELSGEQPHAFAEFYRRNVRWLLGFCARRTRDPELAADLTSEVFAAALLSVDRYRSERGTARTWLLGIAVHKLSNLERRGAVERRARRRLGIDIYALTAADRDAFDELIGSQLPEGPVLELLDLLPIEQAAAVRARVIEGRSYADIARADGISESAVRKRVSRGLRQLRDQIGGRHG
jgi:RNA polymerase sigma-70 factor (ECF subfamily)